MLRIGILGDIGSGKSYVARCFKYPVFNADDEVTRLYKTDVKIFKNSKNHYLNLFIHSQLVKAKLLEQYYLTTII